MFSYDEVKSRVRQQPFVPFRIVTSSGQMFDIFHPDLVLIGRRELTVGVASTEDPTVYEQQTRIAIGHVTALQDLPTPAAPTGNGQK